MSHLFTKILQMLRPKRRWAQFSLGTLLAMVTVLGVWLGLVSRAAHRQQSAVAAISRSGGNCVYDYHIGVYDDHIGEMNAPAQPPGPKWLVDWIGVDYFASVVRVVFRGHEWPAEGLAQIKQLDSLQALAVCCETSPDNVEVFRSLPGVSELSFMYVTQCDALLAAVATMPDVERLTLVNCEASRAGLQSLGQMKRLERLELTYIEVGEEALAEIARLPRLTRLEIYGSEITDAGLLQLQRMPALEQLKLMRTGFSATGLAELQKALPHCKIYFH
jgi:hypothetical protein